MICERILRLTQGSGNEFANSVQAQVSQRRHVTPRQMEVLVEIAGRSPGLMPIGQITPNAATRARRPERMTTTQPAFYYVGLEPRAVTAAEDVWASARRHPLAVMGLVTYSAAQWEAIGTTDDVLARTAATYCGLFLGTGSIGRVGEGALSLRLAAAFQSAGKPVYIAQIVQREAERAEVTWSRVARSHDELVRITPRDPGVAAAARAFDLLPDPQPEVSSDRIDRPRDADRRAARPINEYVTLLAALRPDAPIGVERAAGRPFVGSVARDLLELLTDAQRQDVERRSSDGRSPSDLRSLTDLVNQVVHGFGDGAAQTSKPAAEPTPKPTQDRPPVRRLRIVRDADSGVGGGVGGDEER